MATLPELKKKLKGIKSTEKLTKAMKSVSAAKYSHLNTVHSKHRAYSEECRTLFKEYAGISEEFIPPCNNAAPPAVFVIASNKGMCGGFNTEIFNFFIEKKADFPENTLFFPCGKKSIGYFSEKQIPYEKSYIFSDIPSCDESEAFLRDIISMRENEKISKVFIIYPEFRNAMKQIPVITDFFSAAEGSDEDTDDSNTLFVPDKETVLKSITDAVLGDMMFTILTVTALGAQAATLNTMRSAYDTATVYSAQFETQINRKRQSEVTADVLETATER